MGTRPLAGVFGACGEAMRSDAVVRPHRTGPELQRYHPARTRATLSGRSSQAGGVPTGDRGRCSSRSTQLRRRADDTISSRCPKLQRYHPARTRATTTGRSSQAGGVPTGDQGRSSSRSTQLRRADDTISSRTRSAVASDPRRNAPPRAACRGPGRAAHGSKCARGKAREGLFFVLHGVVVEPRGARIGTQFLLKTIVWPFESRF
jgi:hypothetical protein